MMKLTQKLRAGQRAVVMGLGVSGRAMVRFLLSIDILASVSDRRSLEGLPQEDQDYLRMHQIPFEGGGHSREFLERGDFIAISPGIPSDLPLLQELRDRGIAVLGELAIAAPYLTEPVVAVTGTNGKTTVTSLIAELLRASGKKVFVGGNIGTPLLNYLLGGRQAEVLVLELSSFQLENAGQFHPHIGILLNITPDHLDRHRGMQAYAAAKMNVFARQGPGDMAIIGISDPRCLELRNRLVEQDVYCFGGPKSGCSARGLPGGALTIDVGDGEECYSLAGTKLDSHTGRLNSEAALLAATLLGCKRGDMELGLRAFVPVRHRLQHVAKRNGVDYYNDSKATNTGAVLSALASFSGNIVLIAGGRDKGEEYGVLREPVKEKVKKLLVIGEAAAALGDALGDCVEVRLASSLEEAVAGAAAVARPGDVVLLAPACASFDMFDNYGHRGDVFMAAVLGLPQLNEDQP